MWLPLAVVGGSTLLLIVLWLSVFSFTRGRPGAPDSVLLTLAALSTAGVLLLHLLMVVWTAWVVPVLAAGDPRVSFTPTPRRYRATLRGTVFTPAAIAFGLGFIVAAAVLATGYLELRAIKLAEAGVATVPFLVTAAVLAAIGALVDRPLRRRFLRQMTLRPDCFACGYNLTGITTAHCPECGASRYLGRT